MEKKIKKFWQYIIQKPYSDQGPPLILILISKPARNT